MKKFLTLTLLFIAILSNAEVAIPKLKSRVNDLANILSPSEKASLESQLEQIEKQTSAQIVILTVNTTSPEEIEQYAIRVVEDWKIGQKEKDNGVLLLAALDDRKFRIEVGYGLEGDFTDAYTKMLITKIIVPNFKSGNFHNGFKDVISNMSEILLGTSTYDESSSHKAWSNNQRSQKKGNSKTAIIVIAIFALTFARVIKNKKIKAALGIVIVIIIFLLTFKIILSAIIAIITFLILFSSSGGGTGGHGGYYGGGFSGGGSDFGGGGGGSFGGGGASGDW